MTKGSVVWSEGMFIAPQHFQHLDVSVQTYVNEVAQLDLSTGDFGVSALELNTDAQKIGKFSVREAAGVFPDRLFFRLSKELVIDIPDGLVDETVHLAVPLAIKGTAQFGSETGLARMLKYRSELQDLNDPTNEPVETEMADVGVCLLLDKMDFSGYATIPIARILEKTAEGQVVLDRSFLPQCLRISAAPVLQERLAEIVSLSRVRASNAAGRVATQSDTRSYASLMSERLELQVLNKWLLVLQNAQAEGMMSPRNLYLNLASMAVELDAILGKATSENMMFDAARQATSFDRLWSDLRSKLTLEKPASVVALSWNSELFEKRRVLRLVIPPRLLKENRRLVLALSGSEEASALLALAPLACKLAGLSAMPELVSRGLTGVELTSLPVPPSELRSRSDAAFFSINTSSEHWQSYLGKREALALHVDDRIQRVDATLYLID
ncbi:type VI secretion system baseplate subunit TssK [Epibacterium ulvae]|uniref:type VI secretion system baseplate subunit TssK n=1 Tax=Epibacterium ulvae TaxID=1156985 RepID=UPI0024925002|nr:type VI secretion system baseplate subunit TssK [Epibacterium ulvae]